jgi:hypothetical protein
MDLGREILTSYQTRDAEGEATNKMRGGEIGGCRLKRGNEIPGLPLPDLGIWEAVMEGSVLRSTNRRGVPVHGGATSIQVIVGQMKMEGEVEAGRGIGEMTEDEDLTPSLQEEARGGEAMGLTLNKLVGLYQVVSLQTLLGIVVLSILALRLLAGKITGIVDQVVTIHGDLMIRVRTPEDLHHHQTVVGEELVLIMVLVALLEIEHGGDRVVDREALPDHLYHDEDQGHLGNGLLRLESSLARMIATNGPDGVIRQ